MFDLATDNFRFQIHRGAIRPHHVNHVRLGDGQVLRIGRLLGISTDRFCQFYCQAFPISDLCLDGVACDLFPTVAHLPDVTCVDSWGRLQRQSSGGPRQQTGYGASPWNAFFAAQIDC